MSESDPPPSDARFREPLTVRCPQCDAVVQRGDKRCLMCGRAISADLFVEAATQAAKAALQTERLRQQPITPDPPPLEEAAELPRTARPLAERIQARPMNTPTPPAWRPSPLFFLAVLGAVILAIGGGLFLRQVEATRTAVAAFETRDSVPSLTSPTPTATPTILPTTSATPTITATPPPTETPLPPRLHPVQSGETLISIALQYGLTVLSIAELNGFDVNAPLIREGQQVAIPWPTATPPLQPILLEFGQDAVVVDPSNCPPFYEIQEGDSIFTLAAQNNIPFEAMLELNRLTIDTVLRLGDVICIPQLLENAVLPPIPGPSPTASLTPAPAGPLLLYPPQEFVFDVLDAPLVLQWLAVKDLAPDEYYMVEVVELSDPSAHPRRGFTRQNAFAVPVAWRPPVDGVHQFRWQISIVRVLRRRADGVPIYTYGGRASEPAFFQWRGIVPSPTPMPTATPTAVSE